MGRIKLKKQQKMFLKHLHKEKMDIQLKEGLKDVMIFKTQEELDEFLKKYPYIRTVHEGLNIVIKKLEEKIDELINNQQYEKIAIYYERMMQIQEEMYGTKTLSRSTTVFKLIRPL